MFIYVLEESGRMTRVCWSSVYYVASTTSRYGAERSKIIFRNGDEMVVVETKEEIKELVKVMEKNNEI